MQSRLDNAPQTSLMAAADLGFLLRAALLMALLYGAYYFPFAADSWAARLLGHYLHALTLASHAVIAIFDRQASASGTYIGGRFALQVVKSCSSLDAQGLYVAAVLALPAPPWKKAIGLALGLATLNALNVLRIAGLYFVGACAPRSFDSVHEEILPLVLVVSACGLFAVWTRWSLASTRPPAGAAP